VNSFSFGDFNCGGHDYPFTCSAIKIAKDVVRAGQLAGPCRAVVRSVQQIGLLFNECCDFWGMPVIAMTYPRGKVVGWNVFQCQDSTEMTRAIVNKG